MNVSGTRYARTAGGDSIAYQVIGSGARDVVFVPGFVSHVEQFWSEPAVARFYERLASFSRLILFDKRGTGLSDPLPGPQPLEERMEDVRAVLDAAGVERAALVGLSEGSPMAVVFAATYPNRTSALVLCGSIVGGPSQAHPAGERWEEVASRVRDALGNWGDGSTVRLLSPSAEGTQQQLGAMERAGASPRMARELIAMWLEIDIRDVLASVSVPTLVLHRTDEIFPIEAAREIAARIPSSRLVELPGIDHTPWTGDSDTYLAEIEEFLTGVRERSRTDRVLATVLITDLVGSTERATALGDTGWRRAMIRHDELVRAQLRRFDGAEIKHTGDGFLATFDGPARAIRCARAICAAAPGELGLEVRAGIHTGEVEIVGDDLRGVGVHIAARVSAMAGPGEVLVSSTVKELVTGSGIDLADRGFHRLKGVPGEWRIYSATNSRDAAGRHRQTPG
jgi:pimeloyl-ACP methyl ester carboxylesterase